ncbi:hypothetical protein [Saccharibacillus endophyticus]|uniref:Uncharacterized protein n=1 Tax=Saccharibacillus endophyticus TaxID=2060666 RepID=A0ABQ1ZVC3_9BACL|nr:hypothetical protein [Saccharibacillus endophyticus]GGH78169.1 hypothetical protein GCM10007362_23050 [Saccharibacillus endophyticus]
MKRWMYRGWSDDAAKAQAFFRAFGQGEKSRETKRKMAGTGVARISLFEGSGHWFLYAETEIANERAGIPFEAFFPGLPSVLAGWPGERESRTCVPMSDIFHYRRDADSRSWRRTRQTESYGRLARLRPDKISSYVFYHYQYQEEKPGDGDKYGIIGLHEQWLFFYAERPATLEAAPYEGTLNTRRTPEDWGTVMRPHFIPWTEAEENEDVWLNLERVLEIGAAQEEGE